MIDISGERGRNGVDGCPGAFPGGDGKDAGKSTKGVPGGTADIRMTRVIG